MKLSLRIPEYYRVKKGQTLLEIAQTFLLPPRVLAFCNNLTQEPQAGAILYIPPRCGNLYTVRGGESKKLLCGSDENFEKINCTKLLYPAQIILI